MRAGFLVVLAVVSWPFVVAALGGCSKSQLVDVAMSGAEHPVMASPMRVGDRLVLAGDLHCHIMPPDAPYHVSRDLRSTLALASQEGLDFVVLTPHVHKRFFVEDEYRRWVLETQATLRAHLSELRPTMIVIPGFEYTDFRYGHVGVSFGDPAAVLRELTATEAREHPERFFERWVAQGGILTINHPVNGPLASAPFAELRFDMSWRAFQGQPTPPEITWITAHAQAMETFNTSVTHLRDQFLLEDEDRSLREVAHLVDQTSRQQHRKIAAVGGSDSHGEWLRATTFVLATERSPSAIRDGIAQARTCVRGPAACTLQVRTVDATAESTWAGVGDSLTTTAGRLEVRTVGNDVSYVVNGAIVATAGTGAPLVIAIPKDRCTIVRAIVGRSWSSGVYVNCGF